MQWLWPQIWAGEHGGWWRVIVTIILLVGGILIGDILILALASAGLNDWGKYQPLYIEQMVRPFAVIAVSSLALAGFWVGMRFVHHKPIAYVFTDGRSFRLLFAFQSAAVWLVLWFVTSYLFADRWGHVSQRAHELPLAGLAVLSVALFCATSVQGTLEEVVFRGYLQPRMGAWVKRTWIAIVVVGGLFTAAHPDSWTGPGIIYIVGFSGALGIGGVRAGSLAPLCGMHAANNAMDWLWFPHDSNKMITWPMAIVTVVALLVWLAWLFWMTGQKAVIETSPPLPNEGSAADAGFSPSVFQSRRPGSADFLRSAPTWGLAP
jgi:membrane protease YdiL (CAAX protease family)